MKNVVVQLAVLCFCGISFGESESRLASLVPNTRLSQFCEAAFPKPLVKTHRAAIVKGALAAYQRIVGEGEATDLAHLEESIKKKSSSHPRLKTELAPILAAYSVFKDERSFADFVSTCSEQCSLLGERQPVPTLEDFGARVLESTTSNPVAAAIHNDSSCFFLPNETNQRVFNKFLADIFYSPARIAKLMERYRVGAKVEDETIVRAIQKRKDIPPPAQYEHVEGVPQNPSVPGDIDSVPVPKNPAP